MNITAQIANQLGEKYSNKIRDFILNTPEIQFYYNHLSNIYQWRDGRSIHFNDIWKNESFKDDEDLKEYIYEYLKNNSDIS